MAKLISHSINSQNAETLPKRNPGAILKQEATGIASTQVGIRVHARSSERVGSRTGSDQVHERLANQYGGPISLVLLPKTIAQVAEVMKVCSAHRCSVVPQSGNNSLVAGATPVEDEVVLSLSKMNTIEAFDSQTGIVRCQAGVVLQELQNFVGNQGYATPYDLGATGSCIVGGNLSTMACGIHFVKYGGLRNYVLGLEVVLPDGKILDMIGHLRKDKSGPDLKQLSI